MREIRHLQLLSTEENEAELHQRNTQSETIADEENEV